VNRRISALGAFALLVCVGISAVLFIYLSGRFGGPTVRFSRPYLVSAYLPDSKDLAVRSDVLDRGVHVGQIEQIALRGERTFVTFSVERQYAPIHRDARIQVAEKTLLGESFIALDPGSSSAPRLRSGATLPPAQVLPASVEIDQALNALDPPAVAHLKGVLGTFARGAASPQTEPEVERTLEGLPQLTEQLRELAGNLQGQERYIADGVIDANAVLGELGRRQAQVADVVSGARATLAALAARAGALSAGMHQLPLLLATARRTLSDARPLLVSARPLLGELRIAAPPLATALDRLPLVASQADQLILRLPGFDSVVLPFLALAHPVLGVLAPTATLLGPALRNLVTVADFLSARRNTFTAWFSNTAGFSQSGDAKGKFARFFMFIERGTSSGTRGGDFETNPYTPPNDAYNDQPYSGYPHLLAYDPGLPRR
jgi:phospholipid/cholesterol/gamma-HCH transport system substrate-binding protein